MTKITRRSAVASGLALAATKALPARAADMEIRFYYPIAVSGPITKLVDGYGADFEKENPGVRIKPIYAGDYVQTIGKALIAVKGGDIPECAILLAADIITLTDEDAVIPLDDLVLAQDKAWFEGFYPGFMENARLKGKTYAIPFQRSTPVLYWNKTAFQEAGLDPEKGPADWQEMLDFAKKLTKKDSGGNVTQWGLEIPSDSNTSWLFSGLTAANGVRLMNADGNKTDFDDPRVIEALQFFLDLSKTYGVQPPGLTSWGTAPRDFLEKKLAMIWQTTGNLTNIRTNATFPFGVGMLPKKVALRRADRRRKFLHLQGHLARETGDGLQIREVHDHARTRRRLVDRDRLCRDLAGRLCDAGDGEIHRRFPAGRRGARSIAICRARDHRA